MREAVCAYHRDARDINELPAKTFFRSLLLNMKKENLSLDPTQEEYLLETLPLVRRIAVRRLSRRHPDAIDDITQRVALKLWRWSVRRQIGTETGERENTLLNEEAVNGNNSNNDGGDNGSDGKRYGSSAENKCTRLSATLTFDEWQRLANRTTENEIKTFFAAKHQKEIQLTGNSATEDGRLDIDRLPVPRIEGSTDYEQRSQLCGIWKSFGNLTLRERYAFALKERTLCNLLVAYDCCRVGEIARALDVSREEFIEIYKSLPLDEKQIARLLERKLGKKLTPGLVTKSRQRARAKIRRALTGGNSDGKSSDKEGT